MTIHDAAQTFGAVLALIDPGMSDARMLELLQGARLEYGKADGFSVVVFKSGRYTLQMARHRSPAVILKMLDEYRVFLKNTPALLEAMDDLSKTVYSAPRKGGV